MTTITHHPPGVRPTNLLPGDIFLVHDWIEDKVGELIESRGRARYGTKTGWSNLTHSGGVLTSSGEIGEALQEGTRWDSISKYLDQDLHVIHVDATDEQRALCVARWKANLNQSYSVLAFVGLAFDTVFGFKVAIQKYRSWICSGYVCYGALAYEVDFPLPLNVMIPADIAQHFGMAMDEPPDPLSWFGRLLEKLKLFGRLVQRLF